MVRIVLTSHARHRTKPWRSKRTNSKSTWDGIETQWVLPSIGPSRACWHLVSNYAPTLL
jgi:hypothetical protein